MSHITPSGNVPDRVSAEFGESDNFLGYVGPGVARKVIDGKARIAGGVVTTTVANPNAWFEIQNPAGSGYDVILFGIDAYIDSDAGTIRFYHDATANDNGTVTPFNPNHYYEAATTRAVVRVGNVDLTGGSFLSPEARVTPGAPYSFQGVVIIQPGHRFAARVGGAATGAVLRLNGHWYEEAIA